MGSKDNVTGQNVGISKTARPARAGEIQPGTDNAAGTLGAGGSQHHRSHHLESADFPVEGSREEIDDLLKRDSKPPLH